jgi:hypothetical protein
MHKIVITSGMKFKMEAAFVVARLEKKMAEKGIAASHAQNDVRLIK